MRIDLSTALINGPVNTAYLRGLAEDLRDSGREATADDFCDAAATIDALRAVVEALLARGNPLPLNLIRAANEALEDGGGKA